MHRICQGDKPRRPEGCRRVSSKRAAKPTHQHPLHARLSRAAAPRCCALLRVRISSRNAQRRACQSPCRLRSIPAAGFLVRENKPPSHSARRDSASERLSVWAPSGCRALSPHATSARQAAQSDCAQAAEGVSEVATGSGRLPTRPPTRSPRPNAHSCARHPFFLPLALPSNAAAVFILAAPHYRSLSLLSRLASTYWTLAS